MNQYQISPSASRDLNEISEYFLAQSITAGERFFQEFNRKCKYLTQFPYMGKSYGHLLTDLRGLPLEGYIILYRTIGETVEILRVVHGRQDLEALFRN
ncbi:MAG TPA: type II toxin-antitoxin system RelE/ParE family toxin [Oscillatoriaceae cyanobacterium M33_DOE_052]|uniref:Type II toxin-antitoxin system RelE/ParE family toxin n=1 Tax=Planktothricoides sp. SpSt-374 TaxID=2282167 RepID=A0A7C3VHW6_9CYAN|nr:type II toxin-antitoxin system RelE/ParE family toxin [Oscillatoriaceae cyanobacterium M33_DOE_052]